LSLFLFFVSPATINGFKETFVEAALVRFLDDECVFLPFVMMRMSALLAMTFSDSSVLSSYVAPPLSLLI